MAGKGQRGRVPSVARQAACPWEKQPDSEPKTRTPGEGWLPRFMSSQQGLPGPPGGGRGFLCVNHSRGDVTWQVLSSAMFGLLIVDFSPQENKVSSGPTAPSPQPEGRSCGTPTMCSTLGMPFLIAFSAG